VSLYKKVWLSLSEKPNKKTSLTFYQLLDVGEGGFWENDWEKMNKYNGTILEISQPFTTRKS